MLSNTCKYAFRALIYLAVHADDGEKIGIKKISEELKIPTPFLGKILQTLVKHRILSSTKGPNGGFGTGKNPEDIYLMDIVEIIDGPDSFNQCVMGVKYCAEQEKPCALHTRYARLREEMKNLFQSETIADLAIQVKKGNQKINI